MAVKLTALTKKFHALENQLNGQIQERHQVLHGLIIALLSKKHMLMLGPPGTAKSMIAREVSSRITGCKYFEYLLTRFTTPDEIFGPFSLKALENDRYYRITKNKLPEASLAFIDEVYKGSSAIANSLLTIINERLFHNNGGAESVPLHSIVAASNELPADAEELAAFHDRFLMKYMVSYIHEGGSFEQMLRGAAVIKEADRVTVTMDELEEAQKAVRNVEITDEVFALVGSVRSELQNAGVIVSDRVYNNSQDLIKAETWLMGLKATPAEAISICQHAYWDNPSENSMRQVKMTVLKASSRELLELEKAYEEAASLIVPRRAIGENKELTEAVEHRKKLSRNIRVMEKCIPALEDKNLPTLRYKTMLESATHRLHDITAELISDEMDTITEKASEAALS